MSGTLFICRVTVTLTQSTAFGLWIAVMGVRDDPSPATRAVLDGCSCENDDLVRPSLASHAMSEREMVASGLPAFAESRYSSYAHCRSWFIMRLARA